MYSQTLILFKNSYSGEKRQSNTENHRVLCCIIHMWPALPTGFIAYFETLRNPCVVCWNSSIVEATSTKFSHVFTLSLVPYLQDHLLCTKQAAKFSSILR